MGSYCYTATRYSANLPVVRRCWVRDPAGASYHPHNTPSRDQDVAEEEQPDAEEEAEAEEVQPESAAGAEARHDTARLAPAVEEEEEADAEEVQPGAEAEAEAKHDTARLAPAVEEEAFEPPTKRSRLSDHVRMDESSAVVKPDDDHDPFLPTDESEETPSRFASPCSPPPHISLILGVTPNLLLISL